ncbi:transposable element Tcb1 transposase [Trichonephila clavipes]|nr:transposable element Tcb1 transposase [Trichonephila clavipes]
MADWRQFVHEVILDYVEENSKQIERQWVFGGVERGTGKMFLVAVHGRTKETLIGLIQEWIKPGTTINSDCWKSYKTWGEEKVLKDIKIDPKLRAVKLAAEISRIMGRNVSAETVRNVIRHAGYSSRVARKKPFIRLQNQKKHLEFAKTHQLKTDNFWKKVIFSDESKYNIFGSDGRRTVWRKPNTTLDPKNLRPTVKQGGGSVMVWGCMASNGVGNLVFIDGIIDHKLYIDILNNNLKESAKKLGLDGNFIFQQDNATPNIRHVMSKRGAFFTVNSNFTPPQSPDINVIENLWTTLETAVQKHQIRNKAHLKQVLQEEWDKISPDTTKKLVANRYQPF